MKIILVDDDRIVLDSLSIILENEGIEILGMASSGNEAKSLYERQKPDVLIMDINMGDEDGLEISEEILYQYPEARILILSAFGEPNYVKRAKKIGVRGYLLKESFSSLKTSLELIKNGQTVFDQRVIELENLNSLGEELSSREESVLELISKGYSNKEIAGKLFLSEGTVRNIVSEILSKTGIRDRTGLAISRLKGKI